MKKKKTKNLKKRIKVQKKKKKNTRESIQKLEEKFDSTARKLVNSLVPEDFQVTPTSLVVKVDKLNNWTRDTGYILLMDHILVGIVRPKVGKVLKDSTNLSSKAFSTVSLLSNLESDYEELSHVDNIFLFLFGESMRNVDRELSQVGINESETTTDFDDSGLSTQKFPIDSNMIAAESILNETSSFDSIEEEIEDDDMFILEEEIEDDSDEPTIIEIEDDNNLPSIRIDVIDKKSNPKAYRLYMKTEEILNKIGNRETSSIDDYI